MLTQFMNFNPIWVKFCIKGVTRMYGLIVNFIEIRSVKTALYLGASMNL
jgi:hypothetical protein